MSNGFIELVRSRAKLAKKHIVLPEGEDERMIKAAAFINHEKIARVTLLGNIEKIEKSASVLKLDLKGVDLLDPSKSSFLDEYSKEYYDLRKHKGMDLSNASLKMKNELFYGAMMVRRGVVDGGVCGAVNSTGDVMTAAFHLIGKSETSSIVSSFFSMIIPSYMDKKDHNIFFADCAVIPNPNANELADIAIATAESRIALVGDTPKIAMLSFSTKGSAKHDLVQKVIEATNIVKSKRPDLKIDGELQLDAAIVPKVAESKCKGSILEGNANILIFPDLNSGNIGYKLVQRLCNANAFGPISQGLAKPFNDLSRGCSVDDIINVVAACTLKV